MISLRVGFIGAGKVGTTMGIYLKHNSFDIYGYYSRNYQSAKNAASLTNSKAAVELGDVVENSEILFITTNDDEISKVCDRLIEEKLINESKIVIHMSGAASSRILQELKERDCYIYALHPLQSFANIEKGVKDLKNTVFSLEGDKERIEDIENILKTTGNEYFIIEAEEKALYHVTACVVSNYLVSLLDYGLSIFEAIGIDKDKGFKALNPLIQGSIENIHDLGTTKALTGPIARGDIKTIKNHIEALENIDPKWLHMYKSLGLATIDVAVKEKLIDKEKIEELKKILKEGYYEK